MTIKASERILDRLRSQARSYDRPDVRLASIERLVEACNAIEDGAASDLHRKAYGPYSGLNRHAKISPSNIEKYVRARAKLGAREWSGPTRVFVSADADLRAYVSAREDERLKPLAPRKQRSQRQKEIEDAIGWLPNVEIRQIVRHEIEEGRLARRRLDVLTKGLRSLPGLDVDALLLGSIEQPQNLAAAIPAPTLAHSASMTATDIELLRELLGRLSDAEEMRRVGLDADGNRLRMATAPRTTVIRPLEMTVLRRLAGLEP